MKWSSSNTEIQRSLSVSKTIISKNQAMSPGILVSVNDRRLLNLYPIVAARLILREALSQAVRRIK